MPRNPNKTPCSVPGCRAWAIRGSSPPRCSPHRSRKASPEAGQQASPDPVPTQAGGTGPKGRKIEGRTLSEAEGRTPTVGAPPANQNHLVHGFYSTVLRPKERADLVAYAADTTLDAEIAIARVALRRILGMFLTGVTPGPEPFPLDAQDYARFASLAFQGAGTISRLLRARQALSGDTDPLMGFLTQALEELGEEWGVDLSAK